MAGDPPARLAPAASDDLPAKFARAAADLLNGSLLACEERFSPQGTGSIVLAVAESDAENCHARLRPLAADTLAAVSIPLEVMDRPTADMLRRLAENGLVVPSARASRVLYPRACEPTLTPGE